MNQNTITLIPITEELAVQFLGEVLASIAGFERYPEAYDALWQGYFESLRPYRRWGDFTGQVELQGPRRLSLFVGWDTLYGFFRAWLRRQGIDPDTITPTGTLQPTLTLYEELP